MLVSVVVLPNAAEARCRARCSCPAGPWTWAVEGTVVTEPNDGGVGAPAVPLSLVVEEVFNFNDPVPPKVGDRLASLGFGEGQRVLLLSDFQSFTVIDGGVECQGDRLPREVWVEGLRTGTCSAVLVDAGVPVNPPCNDTRLGCSSAGPQVLFGALLALLAVHRRRRSS
jgi:uncharacterized protein (TIGR03382 family)